MLGGGGYIPPIVLRDSNKSWKKTNLISDMFLFS